MNLIFKKATEKDIPLIAKLANTIWHKHYPSIISTGQIEYMLDKMYSSDALYNQMKEGQKFTIAYDDGIALGYLSYSTQDNKNYFIHKFYVLVNEHRKGIGARLLEEIMNQISEAETIELAVNRENFKAINFYFKQGFVIKNTFDLDIGEGYFMNDFTMIKSLKGATPNY